MALKYKCPQCGKRLIVDEQPGQEVDCPHCGGASTVPDNAKTVPGPAPQAAPVAAAAQDEEAHERTPEEEEEEEEETDELMAGLALYLPSWGTSVVLHVAVLLIAIVANWSIARVDEQHDYNAKTLVKERVKKEEKPKKKYDDEVQSRGTNVAQPSGLYEDVANPNPGLADNQMDAIVDIGTGGGGRGLGGEGLGDGSGRGGSGFFGAGGAPGITKIVYVVDKSGSMTDSIWMVKEELKRSIGELTEDKQFHVIFFSTGPAVEMKTRRLIHATERNKDLAFEFIDNIIADGKTDPSDALKQAFRVKPELIYLLTDGEFDKAIVGLVKDLNAQTGGKVQINTIAFLYDIGEKVLKQIADQNDGNYKFVSEEYIRNMER